MRFMRIYLDNCCFNRPFDDQTQLKISLETQAKLAVQDMIFHKKHTLVWSYILEYENLQNPFEIQIIKEPFDYTKWQENLFDGVSLRELSSAAMNAISE